MAPSMAARDIFGWFCPLTYGALFHGIFVTFPGICYNRWVKP
jgi:hypothetical protein